MADDRVTDSVMKAEKAAVMRPGPRSRTRDRESPRSKSSVVADFSEEVESLRKTTRELKQYNAELKLQVEQQEVSSQILQQGAQMAKV